jgi:hypothetical protein
MTRDTALSLAVDAAQHAAGLARKAEAGVYRSSHPHEAARLAAAGALWADTARAYAAIAQALPETEG